MIAYALATFIGLSLGMLGGGGSILAVPVLIYVLNFPPKVAIASSLAIVGLASLVGVWRHHQQGNVEFKKALTFAASAMLGSFLGSQISSLMSDFAQMTIFAIVMLAASVFMLKDRKEGESKEVGLILILFQALLVGVLTGIVGVGGGFLIVPVLNIFANLPMKKAVGTSLLVIVANSFVAFGGYLLHVKIPWEFLVKFSAFTSLGIFIGVYFANKVPQKLLKKIFGVFLILMSLFVFYKNFALTSV